MLWDFFNSTYPLNQLKQIKWLQLRGKVFFFSILLINYVSLLDDQSKIGEKNIKFNVKIFVPYYSFDSNKLKFLFAKYGF